MATPQFAVRHVNGVAVLIGAVTGQSALKIGNAIGAPRRLQDLTSRFTPGSLFLELHAVYPRTTLWSEMQPSLRVPLRVRVQNRLFGIVTLKAHAVFLLSS